MTAESVSPLAPATPAISARMASPLLTAPILPTLVCLSLPNILAMVASAAVAIAETACAGLLGTTTLAAIALVFPLVMLQQMMSGGAMGGGVSSAIARAIGAGNGERAAALVLHAVLIGAGAGLLFTGVMLVFGPSLYALLLGGRGPVLDEAVAYSSVVFWGAVLIWLTNTLGSVIRGTGEMALPSTVMLLVAGLQIGLGASLALGLGPFPRLGIVGFGWGLLAAYSFGTVAMLWFLLSGRARVRLNFRPKTLRREMFGDILRVGALSCVSPLQTVLTVLVVTRLVSHFGTEALAGYGIGARLEFLVIPVAFAIGVACVPLVGTAIGAGDVRRARQAAWTAGGLAAVIVGAIGLAAAVAPDLWSRLFATDPAVLAAARTYFRWSGPFYAFFGLGLCLYFASQGAGRVLGPVLAGTLRLLVILGGGWVLAATAAPIWTMFALVGLAMLAYGGATALAVIGSDWGKVRPRQI